MQTMDKFLKLGYAAENIKIGEQVEYLPSTGLVRRARPHTTMVTIHEDGSMTEKVITERVKEGE